MQKLSGVASRAQLLPQADMQNEIQVSKFGGVLLAEEANVYLYSDWRVG